MRSLASLVLLSVALVSAAPSPAVSNGTFFEDSFFPTSTSSVVRRDAESDSIATKTWNPPSTMTNALNQVWTHQEQTYNNGNLYAFKNYGWDQLIAAGGTASVCVRWETTSNRAISAADRATILRYLQSSYKGWIDWLVGFEKFPYSNVPVNIVGYAVSNANLIQGKTSSETFTTYTTKDGSGIPECDPRCGRFFNQNNDYSRCPGGKAAHYDFSLWLTEGFGGGAGGDWGGRINLNDYLLNRSPQILQHELGHYFGLDDFYDWTPTGRPNFIMLAGSSMVITPFDGWMLRDWWRHLKNRYGF